MFDRTLAILQAQTELMTEMNRQIGDLGSQIGTLHAQVADHGEILTGHTEQLERLETGMQEVLRRLPPRSDNGA
jgi:hypothetical protein